MDISVTKESIQYDIIGWELAALLLSSPHIEWQLLG
jgi:hypothetical protein